MMKWMKAALLALGLVLFASAACAENTVQYVTREGKTHTIYWTEGITPPAMPNQTPAGKPGAGTFKLVNELGGIVHDPDANTLQCEYYVSEYMPGNGWYDTNKEYGTVHGKYDKNHCFAASGANLLTWWLEQNAAYVDRYLAMNPMPQQLPGLADPREVEAYRVPVRDQLPQNNPIYSLFRDIYVAKGGGFADHTEDLFLNGYAHSEDDYHYNRPEAFRPDSRGGFFYPVFGRNMLTARIGNDNYDNLNVEMKKAILAGNGLTFTFSFNQGQRHAITAWGVEYDENDQLAAVFITDSDDREDQFYENRQSKLVSMVRYSVHRDDHGRTRATTFKNPGINEGSYVETQFTLNLGKAQWESFFQNGSPSEPSEKPDGPGQPHQHELQYSAEGLKIVQTCKTCDLRHWVELSPKELPPYVYDGQPKTPYTFVPSSDNWKEADSGFEPQLLYQNHIDAGEALVQMTYGGVTVETHFKIDMAEQQAPAAPTLKEKTDKSITLDAEAGREYSMDGVNWKRADTNSITFDGLEPGTVYSFYARCAADKNHYASPSSPAASLQTDKGSMPETEFVIRFMLYGDDSIIPAETTEQQKLKNGLPVPAGRIGHAFLGWFNAPVDGVQVQNDTVYQGRTTLYARWQPISYTLTFDAAGGSGVKPMTAVMGTVITPPETVREGYAFLGWEPAFPAVMPAANKVFTAKWEARSYTLTFDTLGGSIVSPQTLGAGADIVPPKNPTKEGFVFAGWEPELPEVMPAGDLTVKAKWTANPVYTLTFDTLGGSIVSPQTLGAGAAIVPPENPTKDGFVFAGWEPELPKVMPAGDLTVKAKWGRQEFQLEGLTAVPQGLKSTPFDTVEKIERKLEQTAAKLLPAGETTEKAFYDLVLYVYDPAGGKRPATREEIEKNGSITVTIPYPAGTSGKTHDFAVAHMITVPVNGMQPGDVETPAPIKRADGLEVTFSGLSPVIVQYTEIQSPAELPKTGDDSRLMLALSCGALAFGAALIMMKRKK